MNDNDKKKLYNKAHDIRKNQVRFINLDNNSKIDLKDFKDKVPANEMQWKAFGSEQGVFGVFKFALKKYGNVSSWRNKCPESKARYLSAMMRHYFKIKNGEDIDPESGLHHGAAMAWNALSYLEFYNRRYGGKMKLYRIGLQYTYYDECVIKAKTLQSAINKAHKLYGHEAKVLTSEKDMWLVDEQLLDAISKEEILD